MDIAKGLEKPCPICDNVDKAHEAQVLPGGDILYRFMCYRCNWPHQRKVRVPNASVEPLVGFRSKSLEWEK